MKHFFYQKKNGHAAFYDELPNTIRANFIFAYIHELTTSRIQICIIIQNKTLLIAIFKFTVLKSKKTTTTKKNKKKNKNKKPPKKQQQQQQQKKQQHENEVI